MEKSPSLEAKAAHMRATYSCYQEDAGNQVPFGKWQRSTNTKSYEVASSSHKHPQRTDKIKIGVRDLSRESIARKDFLALMNKLSIQNRSSIIQTLKHVFREDCLDVYVHVLWDQMQRSSEFHELHMTVIKTLQGLTAKQEVWARKWVDVWDEFVATKKWIPSPQLLAEDDYDEFCDFVKWRKRTMSSIHALRTLHANGWITSLFETLVPVLIQDIVEEFKDHPQGSKASDAYLDILLHLIGKDKDDEEERWSLPVELRKQHDCIHAFIDSIHIENLRPSTRFKMYDLQEYVATKLKPICNSSQTER